MMMRQQHSAVPVDAPSPLVGEGITAAHTTHFGEGYLSAHANAERTPHPSSLREATLSHKGRGTESASPRQTA